MAIIKTKTVAAYKSERDELNATLVGWEAGLQKIADLTSDEALNIRGKIATVKESIGIIDREIERLEIAEAKQERKTNWKAERPLVDEAIDKNYIGYIIPEDKFIYCRDYGAGQSNVQFKLFNATRIVRALSKLAGTNITSRDPNEIIDYFQQRGRCFLDITSSFNQSKWNESEIYNKMSVIRDHWLVPDYENADKYDQTLDILLHCVCGGKQENIEHLERWVAFKYLNPGKNANIPNLDLGGNPGGNGKGRFVELLKTIFTPTCVIQAHKEELEKFNANWEMAVILYYDEPEEKELAAGKLKQATGSEDMRIEKKGIDATMADRNYNFVFLSNNQHGVVKLSGGSDGGEDRRYSVVNTDLVLLDVLMDSGFEKPGALNWLDNLAQNLVKDRVQVARWLAHLIQKHGVRDMTVLTALHGEDYRARFESQKDPSTVAFDHILPVFMAQRMISQSLLAEVVRLMTDNTSHKEHNVMDKFEYYLKRKKIEYKVTERCRWKMLWRGEVVKDYQNKIVHLRADAKGHQFDYSAISSRRWGENAITDVLKKEHLIV
jgi:hypothetical protein